MTRSEVRDAVHKVLCDAQQALGEGEVNPLGDECCPFEAIPGFDSLASVEVTTSVCAALGIADSTANPFLDGGPTTVGRAIDRFCSLAGVTDD
ncbi:MAG: hypothetical protein JNK05_13565 [Myxococcales bacterium]|nr:hypothetical protein [Myxococcales bacterium]